MEHINEKKYTYHVYKNQHKEKPKGDVAQKEMSGFKKDIAKFKVEGTIYDLLNEIKLGKSYCTSEQKNGTKLGTITKGNSYLLQ